MHEYECVREIQLALVPEHYHPDIHRTPDAIVMAWRSLDLTIVKIGSIYVVLDTGDVRQCDSLDDLLEYLRDGQPPETVNPAPEPVTEHRDTTPWPPEFGQP